jgi:endonuclease/exonuclease/phosphatase family metal-dependent hydrolase
LSRLPGRDWRVVRLPALPLRSPIRTNDGRWILTKDEPRAAASAVVEGSAGPLTVTTTHLSFVPGWNVIQLRRLLAQVASLPQPQVLLGDLNMPGELPRSLASWRRLIEAPT